MATPFLESALADLLAGLEGEPAGRERALQSVRSVVERYGLAGAVIDLWDADFRTGESRISPRIKRNLGYEPHEIPDRFDGWLPLLHPDDRERGLGRLHAHLKGGPTYDAEFRVRAKSGEWRWVHARGQASRDDAGRAIYMVGTLIDIQAHKQAEERAARLADFVAALSRTNAAIVRLRDLGALFREVCRICVEHGHASMAFIVMHAGDTIEPVAWAGPAEEFLAGIPRSLDAGLAIGNGPVATAMREDRPYVANDFTADPCTLPWRDRAARIGTQATAAFPIRRGGRVAGAFSVHTTVKGLFDARLVELIEDMVAALSFALDLAEREGARVAAEAQARAGLAQFSRLFHNAPLAATITSLANGRLLDVNDAFCAMVQQPREALLGRTPVDAGLIEPGERDRLIGALRAGHGRLRDFALRGRRSNGEWGDLLVNAELTEFRGEPSMMALYNDVTDLRRAEATEQARRDAEAASRAKTEFLSRMSHELRTPLNAMLGFAQLLQADDAEPLAPTQRARVDQIALAGWHLLALIGDVLDVSRIESGALGLEMQAVALPALVDEVLELSRAQAERHGVTLRARPAASLPAARADATRLRQVLLNVVSNAVKYNRPGGSVEVSLSAAGEHLRIEVADDGLGMDGGQLAHLFEPFNRLGRERGGVEGTGIGLVLSRQLMLLMHGSIDIASEAGRGTRVRLELPWQGAAPGPALPAPPRPPEVAAPGQGPAGRLLYIEDNPVNVLLVRELLARWPRLEVMHAEDGARGIEAARRQRPDVVLVDMRLPDMDGADVLRALRDDPATSALPRVALSASAMPDEVERAREYGAQDYWTKPIDFDRFLADLRRLLPG